MTSIPVLVVTNFNKSFMVKTNASSQGLGAMLMQEGHLVVYMSQTLLERNLNKIVYEKELMVVIMAVQRWRHYLMKKPFIIHTDAKKFKIFGLSEGDGRGLVEVDLQINDV